MRALDIHTSVTVPVSVDAAWRYIAVDYFKHHCTWDPAIVDMQNLTGGPVSVGTIGVETRKFLGRQRARFEVTTFEPTTRFGFRNLTGPFHLERSYELAEAPHGTDIAFTFRMSPKLPAAPLFLLARKQIAAQVVANIERLPTILSSPK